MPSAIYFLLGNLLWELSERRRASKYIQQYKPFPLPSLDKRLWIPSEVSIIVPTIDYDENFQRAIISWLANKPLELIVVTTNSQFLQAKQFVNSAAIRRANHITKIIVTSVPRANKREQLLEGFNHSNGRILAFVDDDVFWRPTTLTQLLAPFEQPDVGLVGTDIQSHVPKERRDPSVITGWEVAALRNRSKRRGGSKAFYVADGSTNFTISGATMLLRAEIVQDPVFQWEFAQETFLGVPQNSGDDSFITRWVLFHHLRAGRQRMRKWRLGIQITPEAFVSTTLKTDSSFVHQMKRWLRTGLRYRLTCIFSDPGFRAFRRTTPYMARKMAEGMLNPILNMLWYISFYQTLRTQPFVALLFALYYLYGLVTGMRAFAREFPYCRRKIWAAIIADKVPQVSDFYCWATLFVENWASRPSIDIKVEEEVEEDFQDLSEYPGWEF